MNEHKRKPRSENRGIREQFRELLDESHSLYPRRRRTYVPVDYCLSGKMESRPLYGIRALAVISENMLNSAKFGRHRKSPYAFEEAYEFFAAVRRCMADVLTYVRVSERIRGKAKERFARRYLELAEIGRAARDAMASPTTATVYLNASDLVLLKAILERCRDVVPEDSALHKYLH